MAQSRFWRVASCWIASGTTAMTSTARNDRCCGRRPVGSDAGAAAASCWGCSWCVPVAVQTSSVQDPACADPTGPSWVRQIPGMLLPQSDLAQGCRGVTFENEWVDMHRRGRWTAPGRLQFPPGSLRLCFLWWTSCPSASCWMSWPFLPGPDALVPPDRTPSAQPVLPRVGAPP